MKATIQGLQEAQRAVLKVLAAVKPQAGLGRALKYLAVGAHRYLLSVTHVDTGAYRSSQFVKKESLTQYRIYISPDARNPYGHKPSIYGPYEERRGGEHAAYRRTVLEGGPQLAGQAVKYLLSELP